MASGARVKDDAYNGPDLLVAVQVLLNCGGEDSGWGKAGNCHEGGSATSAYACTATRRPRFTSISVNNLLARSGTDHAAP